MPDIEVFRLGETRLREHFLNHAEGIFRRLLAANPGHPRVLQLLGVSLFKLGRWDEGIAYLRQAGTANPDNAEAWFDLAVALRDRGQRTQAEAAYAQGAAKLTGAGERDSMPALDAQAFSSEHGEQSVKFIDYTYRPKVRYGAGRPPHAGLGRILAAGRDRYAGFIDRMAEQRADFAQVLDFAKDTALRPYWLNWWFPPLDAIALSTMLRTGRPRVLVEVGSGISTKFARWTIECHGLDTRITSIDPQPRQEIERLVDRQIRRPLEQIPLESFDQLGENDILFIDSSHRAFENSDVTTFFLDVLPRLKPGVLVHIHDVYLPYDYLSAYLDRLWNEQYFLATALLYGGAGLEILFPCWYVSQDPELGALVDQRLRQGPLKHLSLHGVSFWLRKTAHPGVGHA